MNESSILPPEAWVPVSDHPGYEISNHGRVKNTRSRHIRSLKQQPGKYLQLFLPSATGQKNYQLHRIVAEHFLPRSAGATQVDHIDGDITNNAAWNLHWVTQSENILRSLKKRHLGPGREKVGVAFKIRRTDVTKDMWRYFNAASVAASQYGVTVETLHGNLFEQQPVHSRKDVDTEFRRIPGTEHEITSDGLLARQFSDYLIQGSVNGGYLRTKVLIDGKVTSLHRLVLLAWVGPPPSATKKYVVNHKNGIKLDNRLENLEWMTQSENAQHAYDTGLSTYSPRSIGVNKFELDGTFICRLEKIPPKASQAICSKWNHYEGFLYSFKDTIENWTGAAIRELFPDYDPLVCKNIDFDKIRPYVARNSRPVAQWNVDGSPKMIHDTYKTASNALGVSNAVICTLAIATEPISSITKCGYLRWATLRDVLEGLAPRPTIVEPVIATFQVKIAKGSPNVELDYDFLQEYLQVTGTPRPRPVWQLCLETRARVKRYASGNYAEKALGLGRSTIDQAVRKGVKAGGVFWEWADFARDH